jgi:predicted GIY-YIG superfamily endonuclease
MIKEKYKNIKPYNEKGKPTFKKRNVKGVYIIRNKKDILYIGYSGTDLYKTMYRHFQKWNDKSQIRIEYKNTNNLKIDIILTSTKLQASRLEKALIIKYKPKDNPDQYWLNFDTDDKEQEIYKEYLYKNWNVKKVKDNKTNADEYPF